MQVPLQIVVRNLQQSPVPLGVEEKAEIPRPAPPEIP